MTNDALRPRLPDVALAAVLLVVTIVAVQIRMDPKWGDFALGLVALLPALGVLALVAGLPRDEEDAPLPGGTVLVVVGLVLAGLAIGRLGVLLDDDAGESGPLRTFLILAFTGVSAGVTQRSRSGIGLLITALGAAATLISLVAWIGDDGSVDLFRAITFISFAALMGAGVVIGPERGGLLVAAAGVLLLSFAALIGGSVLFFALGAEPVAWGWKAALGVGAVVLGGYAMLHKARGPGYLAFFALLFFAIAVGTQVPDREVDIFDDEGSSGSTPGPTLKGWPIALIVLTVLSAAAAVRPRPATPPPPAPAEPASVPLD